MQAILQGTDIEYQPDYYMGLDVWRELMYYTHKDIEDAELDWYKNNTFMPRRGIESDTKRFKKSMYYFMWVEKQDWECDICHCNVSGDNIFMVDQLPYHHETMEICEHCYAKLLADYV